MSTFAIAGDAGRIEAVNNVAFALVAVTVPHHAANVSAFAISNDAALIGATGNTARISTVCPRYAAGVGCSVFVAFCLDIAAACAACNRARVTSHNAASISRTVCAFDCYCDISVAIADSATGIKSYHAAGSSSADGDGAGDSKILHRAASNVAKQAGVIVIAVDVQIADYLAVAVESAGEVCSRRRG